MLAQKLVESGISKERAQLVEELYKMVNEKIKSVKSKSMWYERRKGVEEVLTILGIDVDELRETMIKRKERVNWKAKYEEMEREMEAMKK